MNPEVIDLSCGVAGAYAARLFADAGASVAYADRSDNPLATGGPRYGVGQFLRLGLPALSVADAVAHHAPIVIVSDDAIGRDRLNSRPTAQIVVAISPYGLDGPLSGTAVSDIVLQAESGGIATRGRPAQEPFMAGGRTVDWVAGAFAATAARAAWRAARLSGRGELIDVSILEVAHITGAVYAPLSYRLGGRQPIKGPSRMIEAPEIHRTSDGWVGFTTNSGQQYEDFVAMLDSPVLTSDPSLAAAGKRQARYDEFTAIVNAWTTARTTAEIVELAAAFRIPCGPVLDAKGVLELDVFEERRVFETANSPRFRYPRRPWRVDDEDPPRRDLLNGTRRTTAPAPLPATALPAAALPATVPPAEARLPLAGVRVLDMTAWWAGPAGTHVLACLGADVIHVESPNRPDGMRMTGGMYGLVGPWWERSSFFLSVNTNKRDLALDIGSPEGGRVFERLLATADVLVENFTPRVLDNLGLSWEGLHARHPRLSVVRMPAFGLDGTWRDRPGFAQTMEQMSGLAWLTGHVDDQPHNQRGPADPNGGVHAAFAALCALDQRDIDGAGHLVETPFIEVALNAAAEAIVECSITGDVPARMGNRSPAAAPQGLYRCIGAEQRVALAVENDGQWHGLVAALGTPAWANNPAFADDAGRRAAHDAIDSHILDWTSSRTVDEAVEVLLLHGVPAGAVRDSRLSDDQPQLRARRFYEDIDHPVVGNLPITTLPFRFASIDTWLRAPAPTFGQHNDEILGELGYDADACRELAAANVTSTVPQGFAAPRPTPPTAPTAPTATPAPRGHST